MQSNEQLLSSSYTVTTLPNITGKTKNKVALSLKKLRFTVGVQDIDNWKLNNIRVKKQDDVLTQVLSEVFSLVK